MMQEYVMPNEVGWYARLAEAVLFNPESRHPIIRPAGTIVRAYPHERDSDKVVLLDEYQGKKLHITTSRSVLSTGVTGEM